ncbi:HAD family hydrolase [Polycladidibacter hongkongensis]|uniref:HAD family hydrolase n=1 Tax=Polycladidibacter hongkongensis TaxID=1647556 RepID=UPI0008340D1D|nr:haloacid dehalogenase-like hydrolase [Pseudovibrio hongkongensis]
MHKTLKRAVTLIFLGICSIGPTSLLASAADPLPSWQDTQTKAAITAFVQAVIDPDNPRFVPQDQRIATLDNDGTLWTEKPLYIHVLANFERMKEQMQQNPSLKKQQPYTAIASKKLDYFKALYENQGLDSLVGQLMAVPYGGMTTNDYANWIRNWAKDWQHPKFKRPLNQLTYAPMRELITYLKDNQFQVYIFTADEGDFLKLFSQELYGIPPQNVFGSSVHRDFTMREEGTAITRAYRIQYINNWSAKARLINATFGHAPTLAAGNSNGDLQMLQYTSANGGLSLLVHHTDDKRETAYDSHTDKVMTNAQKHGWTVIDMVQDWRSVFSK